VKLGRREVEHLSDLARLRFGAGDAASIARDLARVLEYMRVLDEIDTAGVDPMTRAGAAAPPPRRDEHAEGLGVEDALAAAPRRYRGHFLTPKAI
jgi:aspartyl-tRNA(Asn)/glutamyl-tRNA(Gln) amidotransferase subunit C